MSKSLFKGSNQKRKPALRAGFEIFHLVTFTQGEEALLSITLQN